MAILLTKKQFLLSIFYTIVAVALFVLSDTLVIAEDTFWGTCHIYDGWTIYMSMIAFAALSAAVIFSFIGKKIPFLIFTLGYLVVTTMCLITTISGSSIQVGLYITLALIALLVLLTILQMISKRDDAFVKVALSPGDLAFDIFYTVLILTIYIFMKAFKAVEIAYLDDLGMFYQYYSAWNFFGAFIHEVKTITLLEIGVTILLTASAILYWYKKHKIAFVAVMVYVVLLLIALINLFDCPYRTSSFYLVLVFACIPVIFAIIKLRGSIKVNIEKKIEELDFLLKEGVISQEQYEQKVNVLKSQNK